MRHYTSLKKFVIEMSTTVHLEMNDTVIVQPHKGLRSEAILKLSDACDVFLTKDHLLDIKKAIDEHLQNCDHSVQKESSNGNVSVSVHEN